jgi:hypothetical protein
MKTIRELLKALVFSTLVIVGAVAASYAAAQDVPDFESQALATVRPITVPKSTSGDAVICSAVVVEPGYAFTARHCTKIGMYIDGLPVEYVVVGAGSADAAVAYVPGLKCPCAAIGARPSLGETLTAVGYPSEATGERRSHGPSKVVGIDAIKEIYPGKWDDYLGIFIFSEPAILLPGMSGGGAFAQRGTQWEFVGINSIGLPERKPLHPWDHEIPEIASGFVPVDLAPRGR